MTNPFIVSGKIPSEYFCDRESETTLITKWLLNGHNVLLISPRRMGKTGLIYHCFELQEIKDSFITIFVDILQTSSLQEFTFLLGKAVFEALSSKGRKIIENFINSLKSLSGKFTFDAFTGHPSFSIQLGDITSPDYTLDEIFKFIESTSHRCLIAIDEFQQITSYPEKNVEAMLRTHIQHCSNCNFIYSGSRQHLIAEMFLYPNRPFYNSTRIFHLEPIPVNIYTNFAQSLFRRYNKDISKEDIELLYQKFGGTTFYMQSILNESFDRTSIDSECNHSIIEDSIQELIESASGLYREMLSSLKLRQKELLIAIAKNEPVPNIMSSKYISGNGLLSSSSVQAASKKLMEKNLVSRSEAGYQLTDKFLSLWLRKVY